MSAQMRATISMPNRATVAWLKEELASFPMNALVDIHEEPRHNHPTDPGGEKTLIVTWTRTQ